MKLDRIDIRILQELQKNGRITNVELAELVNLSASPCLIRLKRLQSEGYISGYSAQINMAKLGSPLTSFTEITLKNHHKGDFDRFLSKIERIDEIVECYQISGGYDYLLKMLTRDIGEYQSIMERLLALDTGIEKYASIITLRSPITRNHVPLDSLLSA